VPVTNVIVYVASWITNCVFALLPVVEAVRRRADDGAVVVAEFEKVPPPPQQTASLLVGVLMREVMHDEQLRGMFRQFLTKEFSVENLMCWEALTDALTKRTLSEFKAVTLSVLVEFVKEDAPCQVNLAHDVRTEFEKAVADTSFLPAAFDHFAIEDSIADAEVEAVIRRIQAAIRGVLVALEQLMKTDSFGRFKKTLKKWGGGGGWADAAGRGRVAPAAGESGAKCGCLGTAATSRTLTRRSATPHVVVPKVCQ
jgi:hypothetical protein